MGQHSLPCICGLLVIFECDWCLLVQPCLAVSLARHGRLFRRGFVQIRNNGPPMVVGVAKPAFVPVQDFLASHRSDPGDIPKLHREL
jgi:hypothetical protein